MRGKRNRNNQCGLLAVLSRVRASIATRQPAIYHLRPITLRLLSGCQGFAPRPQHQLVKRETDDRPKTSNLPACHISKDDYSMMGAEQCLKDRQTVSVLGPRRQQVGRQARDLVRRSKTAPLTKPGRGGRTGKSISEDGANQSRPDRRCPLCRGG